MDFVALTMSAILLVVAFMHAAWGFGVVWPANSQAELSATVVGTPEAQQMPANVVTMGVAALIALAGLWPLFWRALLWYPQSVPQTLIWFGMWALSVIFLGRGVLGYLPTSSQTTQPFYRLNRLFYSPLCLVLGLGFLVLVLEPIN